MLNKSPLFLNFKMTFHRPQSFAGGGFYTNQNKSNKSHGVSLAIVLLAVIYQAVEISGQMPGLMKNNSTALVIESILNTTKKVTNISIPCVNTTDVILTQAGVTRCRNGGVCVVENAFKRCRCQGSYFLGDFCEKINLEIPHINVQVTTVNFTWTSPIYIDAHYIVYTRTPYSYESQISSMYLEEGVISNITAWGLEPDAKEYILCFINSYYVTNAPQSDNATFLIENGLMDPAKVNCGIVVTRYDLYGPFALAAWFVASVMLLIVLLLMFIRVIAICRDKSTQEKLEHIVPEFLEHFDFLKRISTKRSKSENDPESL